ncbi:hypothetical protein [Pseudomonas sp. SCA2728.1_7]|uniref:hypothetical protein n=1 Tax=Pseudomonas sp. SCA2728.1_7 TaxID=2825975 RepID=UPI0020113E00|nr:hypothetical protein [Pseudomonas sp. SCA2728.1_7]
MQPSEHTQGPHSANPQPSGVTALPVPQVPVILKDEHGAESPDGLLPRTELNRDLQLIVPAWSFTTDPVLGPDIVKVGFRPLGDAFREVNEFKFPFPIEPGDKYVSVPRNYLDNGIYDLSYILIQGGNPAESAKKRITVDRVAPDDGQEPALLEMLDVVGAITDDYLKEHGQVRFQVRSYVGIKARDRAIYFWTDTDKPSDSETEIDEQEFSQIDIDRNELFITMREQDIRDRGEGSRYIYYRLRDWAGNKGPRSELLELFVDLLPAPGNLKPPRVPLSDRGLIDRQHAREGAVAQGAVTVEIDRYDNPGSDNEILLDWNGTPLAPVPVDPSRFPVVVRVLWSALTAKGLGPLTASVTYKVRRPSGTTQPSLGTRVPVDLTLAGQDHANAPALLNPDLAKVEIYGVNSKRLNTLTSDDFGEPAEGILELFDGPLAGQTISLLWGANATPAAQYIVQPGDVAGKRVPFTIPWPIIDQDRENPALPVYYTTSNNVNLQQALTTSVNVSIVVIENLKEPSFPHANKNGVLDCCACPRLWKGVWVKIEGNAAFDKDDEVTLNWQGCKGLNGSEPIPGVTDKFPTILSDAQARDGFEVHVADFERLIAPMVDDGSALCHYTLKKAKGGVGSSKEEFVIINRTLPSGIVCSDKEGEDYCGSPCENSGWGKKFAEHLSAKLPGLLK